MNRNTNRQRVVCLGCGWSGGRTAANPNLLGPCSKCGQNVQAVGAVYVEERVFAGCEACGWWGQRPPSRVVTDCPSCHENVTEPVQLVTLSGKVLA
jgi:hypothetical protein